MKTAKRAYQQTARAEQAHANTTRLLDATVALVQETAHVREVTLDQVAQRAGVTVRTILRRFGSREGLFSAAFRHLFVTTHRERAFAESGDVDAAVEALMDFYERLGDLNIRVLEQEHELPVLHELMELGRREHRRWVEQVFAPQLALLDSRGRQQRVIELYAATDVYLWKLFRRDFHLSRPQTSATFRNLVSAVLNGTRRRCSRSGGSR